MNVLLICGGRRVTPAYLAQVSDELGLSGDDEVDLVSWLPPSTALPVRSHLVASPHTGHWMGGLRSVPVIRAGCVVPPPAAAVTPAAATQAKVLRPIWHPHRIRAAATWRLRRLRRRASGAALTRRLRTRAVSSGAGLFSLFVVTNRGARSVAARSDVVVSLDSRAHQAAWALSRVVPGPPVMAGTVAGARVLGELAAGGPD